MTQWTKRYSVHVGHDEKGFYVNKGWIVVSSTRLSNGQILRLAFSKLDEHTITPHLVVHHRFSLRKWPRKDGTPTGPKSVETWEVVRRIFFEGVYEAHCALLGNADDAWMEVTGATPKLFAIYRRFLRDYVRNEKAEEYLEVRLTPELYSRTLVA